MEEDQITAKLLAMKISNWESIPYSNTLQCPNDDDGGLDDGNKIYIGWCDTPWALMKVCECPICHQKYRFHGVLQERWNLEQFLVNLYYDIKLRNKLEDKKQL